MNRSFRYRIYPTKAQERTLREWLDMSRELYNAALQEKRDAWTKQRVRVSMFDQMKALPGIRDVRPEFRTISIAALRGTLRRLDRSFADFFRRVRRGAVPGFPRFKGRDRFNSILINDLEGKNPIAGGGKRLTVHRIGKLKIKLHRPLEGTPKSLGLKLDGDGKWYAILACVDVPLAVLPPTERAVGIDLGLSSLVATSDGELIENPRSLERARLAVERAQRTLSRRHKGSRRRLKARTQLSKKHFRVKQLRRAVAISTAGTLARHYDAIVVEDLNIGGMVRSRFAKPLHDAAWSTLLHWISVKAESAGREVIKVDPRGTSQRCSGCGAEVRKDLSVRIHDCPHCGLVLDRDVNAARNILALGLSVRRAAPVVKGRQRPEKRVTAGSLRGEP